MEELGLGCLSSAHFSIILNGSPKGFFPASMGLRQGDPLSLFLFTLILDSLSQIPINNESKNLFKGVGFEKVNVSHLQFPNDTLILKDAEPRFIRILKLLIQRLKLVCGLKVNWSKIHILDLALTKTECIEMASLLGCSHKEWPLLGFTTRGAHQERENFGTRL